MGRALHQRRPASFFGKRFAAVLWLLALAGPVVSPAAAGVPLGVEITKPVRIVDPCRSGPLQISSFAPTSSSIVLGTNTYLNWSVQVPAGCAFSLAVVARPQIDLSTGAPLDWNDWGWQGVAAQPQGSLPVQPAYNTAYWLYLTTSSAQVVLDAKVAVTLPLANTKCVDVTTLSTSLTGRAADFTLVKARLPCRNAVTIDANNLAPLLVQALGTPNTTVIVKNGVELDLTPHLGNVSCIDLPYPTQPGCSAAIHIADGVQLIGERVAEPGKPFQPGPHLFVRPDPNTFSFSSWPWPLFQIDGDNVRISGVRLEGPGAPPDAWRSIIQGYTKGIWFFDKISIEIDHNEFSGWNTAAVEAVGHFDPTNDRVWQKWTSNVVTADASGIHYPAGLEPVNIHDNYFHNNFYPPASQPWSSCSPAGPERACEPYFGYGVAVSGTHVLIERNVFNDYFHAISANGCPGSGYRAYRNLVLANGGADHAFDVHGRNTKDCGGPEYAAGRDFDVRWNSFLFKEWALYMNGTPDVGAFVSSNVFTNDHVKGVYSTDPVTDAAVVLGSHGDWGKVWLDGTNLEGVKTWFDASHFSTDCDFDGDGFNDTFITTGETWWFQSRDQRNGPPPWVYLNTNTLLVENVSLGYFSTGSVLNHVCDVATGDGGYKGGTGSYGPLN